MLATVAVAVSGSTTRTRSTDPSTTGPLPDLQTRATYRLLLMRGLAPEEAANLTAFMSGIHVGDQRWNLKEINQLLFLRQMKRTGKFDEAEGTLIH